MNRIIVLAATAAAAICVWLGLSYFDTNRAGMSAFARAAEQIRMAKDITWTDTVYVVVTSKDGRRHWHDAHVFKNAYKAPGLYRTTALDKRGNVEWIEITDAVRMKVLTLDPNAKTARIAEVRPHRHAEGPFLGAQRALKDANLQFVERRKTPTGDINVFRNVEGECFFDYWIDQNSKQLVEYRINQDPRVTLADYENDPSRNATPEKEASGGSIVGSIAKDIVYNADVDDSLFGFDVPQGFTIETLKRHFVSEQEMIDFVRVVVEANGRVFPDDIADIPSNLFNKYNDMPKTKRPPEGQKLIEMADHYGRIELHGMPLREFLLDNADWISFRYVGKGVKLGDRNAFVRWYKLKNVNDPRLYRVVYGDLSVKDVAAGDLPLPVGP